jgi:hypothetical protein
MGSCGRFGALSALVFAAALVASAGVDARADARATYRVTLTGKLSKTWNYVLASEQGDCTILTRVEGTRTITLRSVRPTSVTVTGSPGRARFNPPLVRSITAGATQRGAVRVTERGPGCGRVIIQDCAPQRTTLRNQTVRFYRTRPGELSFRRTRDFGAGLSRTCPPQHPEVLVEQPALRDAEGDIVERQLFDADYRSQTVTGSFEEETDIEGNPDGEVVERVTWTLRFVRR